MHKARRRPAGFVEDIDQEVQLGLAIDATVFGNARNKPAGVVGIDVALGLGLIDNIVGDRLDKKGGQTGSCTEEASLTANSISASSAEIVPSS